MLSVTADHPRDTPAPAHGGVYQHETADQWEQGVADEGDGEVDGLELRPETLFYNRRHQTTARQHRKIYGHTKRLLTVGAYVAYKTNYTAETRTEDQQDFWVGQVTSVDVGPRTVSLRMWHTGTLRNGGLRGHNMQYKKWSGTKNATQRDTVVHMRDIFETFKMSERRRIPKRTVAVIMDAKTLWDTDHAVYDDPPIERGNIDDMDRGKVNIPDAVHLNENRDPVGA